MTESDGEPLLERLQRLFRGGNGGRAKSQPSLPDTKKDGSSGCNDGEKISCREAVDRIYEFLDGELTEEKAREIRCHVRQCDRCYPMYDWERMFLDYVRDRADHPEDNPKLRRKVESMLERRA